MGADWIFEKRPGGWIVASRTGPSGTQERFRFQSKGCHFVSKGTAFHLKPPASKGRNRQGGEESDLEETLRTAFTSSFPGRVRKVLVKGGESVKKGQVLLQVEAMKMEFSIKAPVDGCVRAVKVKEGDQLAPGDRYLDFEVRSK